jgi:uncharacterized protein YdaU (DUF1376 family)
MSENPWYAFYVGDYQSKTAHLSLLEHGAYRLLLDHYYATQHPLPNDPPKLFRICRARTPSERQAVLSTATEFFIKDGTLLRHETCDREIAKRLKYRDAQSAKAKLRHCRADAAAVHRARVPQSQSQSDKKERQQGSRFALTELPHTWKDFCNAKRPDLDADELFAEFRDYWSSVPGQRGRKLDWLATWRNRVRDKKQTGGSHDQRTHSRKTAFDNLIAGSLKATPFQPQN